MLLLCLAVVAVGCGARGLGPYRHTIPGKGDALSFLHLQLFLFHICGGSMVLASVVRVTYSLYFRIVDFSNTLEAQVEQRTRELTAAIGVSTNEARVHKRRFQGPPLSRPLAPCRSCKRPRRRQRRPAAPNPSSWPT